VKQDIHSPWRLWFCCLWVWVRQKRKTASPFCISQLSPRRSMFSVLVVSRATLP